MGKEKDGPGPANLNVRESTFDPIQAFKPTKPGSSLRTNLPVGKRACAEPVPESIASQPAVGQYQIQDSLDGHR